MKNKIKDASLKENAYIIARGGFIKIWIWKRYKNDFNTVFIRYGIDKYLRYVQATWIFGTLKKRILFYVITDKQRFNAIFDDLKEKYDFAAILNL